MKNTTNLFDEFPAVSKAEWLARVEKDLKGKPLADLDFQIGEIALTPFFHPADMAATPPPLPLQAGWEIGEDINVGEDLPAANKQLLAALEAGVNAPRLVLERHLSAEELSHLLAQVHPEMIAIQFYFVGEKVELTAQLTAFKKFVETQGLDINGIKAGFNWKNSQAVTTEDMRRALSFLSAAGHQLKIMPANGVSDCSDEEPVAELVALLQKGERYLHEFASGAFSPTAIHQCLFFSVAVGKNYFLQIAKLRALVLLWSNVLKAYRITADMPLIDVHLSAASQSDDDHANMIAATTQAMSAVIGGAHRLTVLPADAHRGTASDFTKRISRNVQHLMAQESHLGKVADPAAGSYFIEQLTGHLAAKAWARFQESC